MNYFPITNHPEQYAEPRILHIVDNFLSQAELKQYQALMTTGWTPSPSVENFKYLSKDLYKHYGWDGDWHDVRWLDQTPIEWEKLYHKIASYLPAHRVHWVDIKITTPLSTGTPLHRDKDPWLDADTDRIFQKALIAICNLNSEWDPSWGGSLIVHRAQLENHTVCYTEKCRVPITAGQLIVAENFYHSIEPIIEPECHRISFILHALQHR